MQFEVDQILHLIIFKSCLVSICHGFGAGFFIMLQTLALLDLHMTIDLLVLLLRCSLVTSNSLRHLRISVKRWRPAPLKALSLLLITGSNRFFLAFTLLVHFSIVVSWCFEPAAFLNEWWDLLLLLR